MNIITVSRGTYSISVASHDRATAMARISSWNCPKEPLRQPAIDFSGQMSKSADDRSAAQRSPSTPALSRDH